MTRALRLNPSINNRNLKRLHIAAMVCITLVAICPSHPATADVDAGKRQADIDAGTTTFLESLEPVARQAADEPGNELANRGKFA